jgi:hypothetical protein
MTKSLTSSAVFLSCVWFLSLLPTGDAAGQNAKSQPKPAAGANASAAETGSTSTRTQLQPVPETGLRPLPFDPYESFANAPPSYVGPSYPMTACPPVRQNRYRAFLEYLYLQPGSAARTGYALPINGAVLPPPTPPVPLGQTAIVDPPYQSGVRLGVAMALDPCRPRDDWSLVYSYLQSSADDSLSVDPQTSTVIQALVLHPSTLAADQVYLDAAGHGDLEFHLLDIERRANPVDCGYQLNAILGARFARLEQDFGARFTNSTTVEDVGTEINFDGGGFKLGLDGQLQSPRNRLLLYGRGTASFLAGTFRSSYVQNDSFRGVVAQSSRSDDSIVPILDLEMGIGWTSRQDRWQLRLGYLFNAWYNVVSNERLIHSVQQAQAGDIRDTLTFDGLVARAEFRF